MSRIVRVTTDPDTIRRLYAEARIEERYDVGELSMRVRWSGTPTSKDEPKGTRSETVGFHNRWGMLICIAHHYVRPSGKLGASGERDPKYLRIGGTVYTVPRDPLWTDLHSK